MSESRQQLAVGLLIKLCDTPIDKSGPVLDYREAETAATRVNRKHAPTTRYFRLHRLGEAISLIGHYDCTEMRDLLVSHRRRWLSLQTTDESAESGLNLRHDCSKLAGHDRLEIGIKNVFVDEDRPHVWRDFATLVPPDSTTAHASQDKAQVPL